MRFNIVAFVNTTLFCQQIRTKGFIKFKVVGKLDSILKPEAD